MTGRQKSAAGVAGAKALKIQADPIFEPYGDVLVETKGFGLKIAKNCSRNWLVSPRDDVVRQLTACSTG